MGAPTVLVVDDDASLRLTTTILLDSGGYDSRQAAGAREALAILDDPACGIGLVLMDVVMPGMTGPQALAALRARGSAVPVILTSGYGQELPQLAADVPAVWFLPKPYRPERLFSLLAKILRPAAN